MNSRNKALYAKRKSADYYGNAWIFFYINYLLVYDKQLKYDIVYIVLKIPIHFIKSKKIKGKIKGDYL